MSLYPRKYSYTKEHLWLDINEDVVVVGLTEYIIEKFDDIESLELPTVGDEFEIGEECIFIHRIKQIKCITAPLSGRITKVNEMVEDNISQVLSSPYKKGWLFEMEYDDDDETYMLLSSKDYEEES